MDGLQRLVPPCDDVARRGHGWLHSSQIASLRHGQTRNPGPRTFVAIERLNYYLWLYTTEKKLIPGTPSSNDYKEAVPITEDSQAPPLGWFVEVFCGFRVPKDFDLSVIRIPNGQAVQYMKRIGRLLRQNMVDAGFDVVEDLNSALYQHYPTKERDALDRARSVVLGQGELDEQALEQELDGLAVFSQELGGSDSTEDFMNKVRS